MGKSILITGAGRGLGKSLVDVLGEAGHNLVLHSGRRNGDLRDSKTVRKLTRWADKNDINILINNAAVYMNKRFMNAPIEEFQEVVNTNLLAPIALTHSIWPILKRNPGSLVIFINSVAGKTGSPGELAYCTSKFGLRGFAESLQYDGMWDKVRVVSVYLGAMRTDMTKDRGGDPMMNIDPHEVALIIRDLCQEYKGAEVSEITIDKIGKASLK